MHYLKINVATLELTTAINQDFMSKFCQVMAGSSRYVNQRKNSQIRTIMLQTQAFVFKLYKITKLSNVKNALR